MILLEVTKTTSPHLRSDCFIWTPIVPLAEIKTISYHFVSNRLIWISIFSLEVIKTTSLVWGRDTEPEPRSWSRPVLAGAGKDGKLEAWGAYALPDRILGGIKWPMSPPPPRIFGEAENFANVVTKDYNPKMQWNSKNKAILSILGKIFWRGMPPPPPKKI